MNWGIIGYGEIAPSFIKALLRKKDSNLRGIASISSFEYLRKKKLYGSVPIYNSYSELLRSEDIDVVYICTTNNLHFQNTKDSLNAGKHVLCEKPITPTFSQTKSLCQLAKAKNLFLVEGMWTRFLPVYQEAMRLISKGIIGKPKLLKADFGFLNNWPKHRRLLNPDLFGGTLLDNADYNIFLSQDIFKEFPSKISAHATFAETGVENSCSILMSYPNGGMSQLFSSFNCNTKHDAIIYGEKGHIKLCEFWHGTKIEISLMNENSEVKEFQFECNGFEYEIQEVETLILSGAIESKVISHKMSKEVAMIIDEIKKIIKKP